VANATLHRRHARQTLQPEFAIVDDLRNLQTLYFSLGPTNATASSTEHVREAQNSMPALSE
jgi:hypothetical protein